MGVTRVDQLTDAEKGRFNEWADKWIEIGLRTGPAHRDLFEKSVRDCYRFAGIPFPDVVVWVPSPMVVSLAAPTAALAIELVEAEYRGTITIGASKRAVRGAVRDAVGGVISRTYYRYMGGQLWAGGWWWGGARTSFFRDVCNLDLPGDTWDRARAYEGTIESACWWWPHRRFVMVCERPVAIHRELADPDVERGWGSHRLHCEDGPAVVWPDGWGVWSWHGVRVPQHVIEDPASITAAEVLAEENAEVRRVMVERMTPERFLAESDAKPVQQDDYGKLWRVDMPDDEPLVMVELLNSTVEPDGNRKIYFLRVDPNCRTALEAVAWTFDQKPEEYVLCAES